MEPPEPLVGMVSSARRRLWGSRLVGELTVWLGVGASGAAALWGFSQVMVAPWSDQAGVVLLAATMVGGVGWWATHRPTSAQAALWADQRLGGEDRLATAWELSADSVLGPAARRQISEARRWAEGADRARMGGEYPSAKVVTLAATAVTAALALAAAPSLTDRARAEQQEVRQVVDRELEVVESLAAEGPEELSESLGELAEALAETATLEEAVSALSSTRLDLEESLSPNRLAENTALQGLATRLARFPVGRGDDPASRLSDLASGLGDLSPAQREAVAGELAERAADFAGINDELASALAEAAGALTGDDFDLGQAVDALGSAASEITSAERRAASANAVAEAAAALAESERRLQDAQGQGTGQGSEGTGQGSGRGGDSGQGGGSSGAGSGSQGQGSGAGGQGQGTGDGGGGQGPSSGQGMGSITGVGDNDPAEAPRYSSTVFEPPAGGLEEEVRVAIEGDGPGVVSGSAVGPSVSNQSLVPYTERLAEYQAAALASLERRPLPSHLTEVVQSYFTELEP